MAVSLAVRGFARLAGLLCGMQIAVAAAQPTSLTLIEPYGVPSSTGTGATVLRDVLSRRLGIPVEVRSMPGEAGGVAQDAVAAAPPDGSVVLVGQLLTPWMFKPRGTPPRTLGQFEPVVRLTPGLSTVLFVATSSPIHGWDDFAAAAKAGNVDMAWNSSYLFAIPMAMLEGHLGVRFRDVVRHTRASMIDAVLNGTAQAALLPTESLVSTGKDMRLRPIMTFGGARNPVLNVPTFRETVTGKKEPGRVDAITGSIAVFAPPGTPAQVRARLETAFVAAGKDASVQAEAARNNYPLRVTGPQDVREAMARDARVHNGLTGKLRSPQ